MILTSVIKCWCINDKTKARERNDLKRSEKDKTSIDMNNAFQSVGDVIRCRVIQVLLPLKQTE